MNYSSDFDCSLCIKSERINVSPLWCVYLIFWVIVAIGKVQMMKMIYIDFKNSVYYVGSLWFCFIELCYTIIMTATTFLEHDNVSFSKILLSKEVADIIKQVVKESTKTIHPNCNDGENFKGVHNGQWFRISMQSKLLV